MFQTETSAKGKSIEQIADEIEETEDKVLGESAIPYRSSSYI